MSWLWLAACERIVRTDGQIAGEDIELVDGFYVLFTGEEQQTLGHGQIEIWVTGVPNACETYVALNRAAASALTAAELAEVWAAHMPETFWEIRLTLFQAENGIGRESVPGYDWGESSTEDVSEFRGQVLRVHALGEAWFEGNGEPIASWSTDGGKLVHEIEGVGPYPVDWEGLGTYRGAFETTAVLAADGSAEGEIQVRFTVERCDALKPFVTPVWSFF